MAQTGKQKKINPLSPKGFCDLEQENPPRADGTGHTFKQKSVKEKYVLITTTGEKCTTVLQMMKTVSRIFSVGKINFKKI